MKIVPIKTPKNWKNLKIRPEAALSDLGAGVDPDDVIADMKKNGYSKEEPVVLYEGDIGDGRLRHKCAIKADVEPTFANFVGTYLEFLLFVRRRRINRQNTNQSQRSLYIAEWTKIWDKAAPKEENDKPIDVPETVDERAATAGVSSRTQDYAEAVSKDASEPVKRLIESDKATVSDAAKIVGEEKAIQTAAAKLVEAGAATTLIGALDMICARCRRLGGRVKDCKQCAQREEKARRKALKKKAKARQPSQGKVKFNDTKVENAIHALAKVFNDRAKALGQLKSSRYGAVRDRTSKLIGAWKHWQKEQEQP